MATATVVEPTDMVTQAGSEAKSLVAGTKAFPAGRTMEAGGLVPRNLEEAAKFAQLVYKSAFIPQAFRDKPGDVLAAIVYGADLGLPPMQALQVIAVINGKPSVYGDGFLAVIYNQPSFQDHEEFYDVGGVQKDYLSPADMKLDTTMAVCKFTRKGRKKPTVRTFSIAQAKTAQLWTKQGPWTQYPDRMLMYRARGFAGRDTFPDGLRGIISVEEANDIPTMALAVDEITLPQRQSEVVRQNEAASMSPGQSLVDALDEKAEAERRVAAVKAEESALRARDEADRASGPLPDGCDLVAHCDPRKSQSGKTYFVGETSRGVKFYTWSTSVAEQAITAKDSGQAVTPVFSEREPWNGQRELVSLQPGPA